MSRPRRPHNLRILTRYAAYLLWEFRWSLLIFWSLVLGGGLILFLFYHDGDGNRLLSYGEACYGIFLAIFLESYLKFPREAYLQPLFFLLPIIGLGAVADSLVRLAYLMFARKQNLPEWQRMVAALYRDHTVVVGIGKVGYEIIKGLLDLREPVVAIERPGTDSTLIDEIIHLQVPILHGDGRARLTLERAGVAHARAVVLATSDDLANLDAGLTAFDLNPKARIILRLFDESLAKKVRGAFALPAISTSRVAAPAFVAAATGRKIYQDLQLADQKLSLTDLTIDAGGRLAGLSVGELQSRHQVNVVMHSGRTGVNANPDHAIALDPGDEILVVAPIEQLLALASSNQPVASPQPRAEPQPIQTDP